MRFEATFLTFACLLGEIRTIEIHYPTIKPKIYETTSKVFLDVMQGDTSLGRIVIALYEKDTPITAGYFRALATTGINDTFLEGSFFHKIVKGFKVQGGEGMDINLLYDEEVEAYSYTVQEEEGKVPHAAAGVVSMASRGPHMKWTEFFITTIPTPWLDFHDVPFGKVESGMNVVKKIETANVTIEARPIIPIYIKKCGLVLKNETRSHKRFTTVITT
nr:PREDICTED: peptidyl-prolyl cis-trans isomerase B1-like isoform X2 [Bemisia tabaci]